MTDRKTPRCARCLARLFFALPLVLAAQFVGAPAATADTSWQQSTSIWRLMDKCTRAAQKAFPDYTREANTKREAYRRTCLRNSNLPGVDEPPTPAPPQR